METDRLDDLLGPGFTPDATASHAPAGRYYTDPDLHRAELDRVFAREWNFVCHQTQLPNPGDYCVREIADESIFFTRGQDQAIRGFYNVCQHRGHQLLGRSTGTIRNVVVCPYHAWSYGLDGALRGAPKMRNVPGFDKTDIALTPVRIEIIGGFVFANLDDEAPSLRKMAPRFEEILTSMVAEADDLELVKVSSYDIAANWKIVTENFLEAYHVEFSGPAHQALGTIIDVDTYRFSISGRTIEYTAAGGPADALPYMSNSEDDFTNSRGAPFHQVFLYPHMTFSVFPGTNMLFVYNMRPNGPERCAEEILYFSLGTDWSDETKSAEAYVSEQLNHEDIALVEAVHRGVRSRGYRPGRLMVDADQEAGWSEQFVHHFNQLHLTALRRDADALKPRIGAS